MRILLDEPELRVAPTRKHTGTENFGSVFASWIRSLTYFGPFLGGLIIVQNQLEATHRATSGILCSHSHQRLTNIYLKRFVDLTMGFLGLLKLTSVWSITPHKPPVRISA
jgi:hypothetical protein